MRSFGSAASVLGILVSSGVFIFALMMPTLHPRDRQQLARVATLGAAIALVGALLELFGIRNDLGTGWDVAITSQFGRAAGLRLLSATIFLMAGVDAASRSRTRVHRDDDVDDGDAEPLELVLLPAGLLGLFSFALDGHSVAEGPRLIHGFVNAVHATSAAVWLGGVVSLAALAARRRGHIGAETKAFTPIATVATVALVIAGVVMATFIIDSPSQLTGSPWGRRLLLKVFAVAIALGLGAYHRSSGQRGQQLGRTLTVEAAVLLGAAVVTGLLVNSSPL